MGECWENTREAYKTPAVAEKAARISRRVGTTEYLEYGWDRLGQKIFRAFLNRSLVEESKNCTGVKKSKERLTYAFLSMLAVGKKTYRYRKVCQAKMLQRHS